MSPVSFKIGSHVLTAQLGQVPPFSVRGLFRSTRVHVSSARDPIADVNVRLAKNPRNVLLIDSNVHRLYGANLDWPKSQTLICTVSEEFKSMRGFQEIVEFFDRNRLTKSEQIVIVGGGILQDVGSFAASVFKRGLDWIYFPTTLLSQSDSCIGGKTNINFNSAKNLIGGFHSAVEVHVNSEFLKTLHEADIRSGCGEILKSHVLAGPEALASYEKNQMATLDSLAIKRAIVEADEFESGTRRALNYGHTFGHAIESILDFTIPHGLCVAAGLICANRMSHQLGFLSEAEMVRVEQLARKLLNENELKTLAKLRELKRDELDAILGRDKKSEAQAMRFVLLERLGEIRFELVPNESAQIDRVLKIMQTAF